MVPVKRDERAFAAAALIAGALLLSGCETAPPDTADYWTPAQTQAQSTYLTIGVHSGDTLSAIAARYDVAPEAIARMNDLSDQNAIYAGQSLKLPAGPKETRRAVLAEAEQPGYARWNAPGAIDKVTVEELRAPPSHRAPAAETAPVMPKALTLDAALADEAAEEIAKATARAAAAPPATKERAGSEKTAAAGAAKAAAGAQPKPESGSPPKTANASTAPKAAEAASGSTAEFEWPVQGKIIARFGKDDDGERNDGINIAADLGTPIHAAADGTVTYAGNELKSYGNLVLIRHDNGYVTAYAHAQRITVTRGAHVARGEVIGYAGETGDVTTPQVHFEIRQGVKPVDPKPLLMAARES